MLTSLFSSPVLNLLYQTDLFTKILLLMLMLLSLATLTLGLYKSMELWREHKELSRLITRLRTVQTLYEYKSISSSYTGNYGKLFQLLIKESGQLSFRDFLRQDQKELFLTKSDHHVQDTLLLYQAGTGFLGTSGAISPLIGLFGTVWGLIHSFLIISLEKSADIATVAPGIAEALMTTLFGLIVAIPALITFHYCLYKIRALEIALYQLSDLVFCVTQKEMRPEEELCHEIVAGRAAHL